MQTARVPGLAVAVLHDGKLTGVRAFGVRDATSLDPARADTIFEAASLSKVVTAYTALRLVQQGKLALDTPLVTWAPSPCDTDQPLAAKITLRHALTHSTGFRNWRFKKEIVSVNLGDVGVRFDSGEVTVDALKEKGLIPRSATLVKILGDGQFAKKLTIVAHYFSKSAKDKIEKAGGSARVIEQPPSKEAAPAAK
jgi:hypothetical protein